MDMLIVNFILHYAIRDLLKSIAPTFLSTMAMALSLYFVNKIHSFSNVPQLVLMILAGVLTYFVLLWFVEPRNPFAGCGA